MLKKDQKVAQLKAEIEGNEKSIENLKQMIKTLEGTLDALTI